nr:MAG TPA: hypothetical protein [Inoviridae sp.]
MCSSYIIAQRRFAVYFFCPKNGGFLGENV